MNTIFIKKTKSEKIIAVERGMLTINGKMAESLRNIPTNLKATAEKALLGADAISEGILFSKAETEKIASAIEKTLGYNPETVGKEYTIKDSDFIPANISIPSCPTFNSAIDGQYEIYKD